MTSADGIVFCFDSAYVWPACVAMHSVLRTWASSETPTLYCLGDSSLSPRDRAAVAAVARHGGAVLELVDVDIAVPEIRIEHLSAMAYARVLAPRLIDARRLIYLDCDVIVRTSMHALLRPIAGGCAVAAARDVYGPELSAPHIGPQRFPFGRRDGSFPYFNSGVLAIDVQRWREQGITERAEPLIRDPEWRPALDDQDTLNYVLEGHFELLDPRWNVAAVNFLNRSFGSTAMPGDRYVPAAYQRDLEASPWIVHYLTKLKPWTTDYGDDPLGTLWHQTADATREVLAAAGVAGPASFPSGA